MVHTLNEFIQPLDILKYDWTSRTNKLISGVGLKSLHVQGNVDRGILHDLSFTYLVDRSNVITRHVVINYHSLVENW